MTQIAGSTWLAAAIVFAVGAVLGRFLNHCVDRFGRHEYLGEQLASLITFSAAERTLRKARRPLHVVPVFGWFIAGNPLSQGRGADLTRALVELGNGLLLAVLVVAEFPAGFGSPPSVDVFAVEGIPLASAAAHSLTLQFVRFALHALLVESLLVATVIDFRQMIIPDGSTVPTMLLALVASAAAGGIWLVPLWYEDTQLLAILQFHDDWGGGVRIPRFLVEHPHLHGFLVSLAGLIVGGGVVWVVRLIGHWTLGREAMGFGDVMLMAMIGAAIGWQAVLVVFFLSPACAIVVILFALLTGAYREFPFGPWLSLATVVLLVGWQAIWPAVGGFFFAGRLIPVVGIGMVFLLFVLLKLARLIRGDRYWAETSGEQWTSAHQLHYQSQETPASAPIA